ncbi:MAG: hypothetical protein AAGI23_15550 [Bacteroidota bacterium]
MMRTFFTYLFILFAWSQISATPTSVASTYNGYIVTLDGKKLTGQIGDIFFSDEISVVLFINDFGTSYHLQAELITGFVFQQEDKVIEYESLFRPATRAWSFLRVVEKGAILSLFKSPEEKMEFTLGEGGDELNGQRVQVEEYWLKFKGERSVKLTRFGYKRQLKDILKAYPAMVKLIGKPGYKYKDMERIVQEVNELYLSKKNTL